MTTLTKKRRKRRHWSREARIVETTQRFWKLKIPGSARGHLVDFRDKAQRVAWENIYQDVVREDLLVEAARAYGDALKRQHKASAAMHRARKKPTATLREREHDAACDALDRAQHELLVCGAMLTGFSRRSARRSV